MKANVQMEVTNPRECHLNQLIGYNKCSVFAYSLCGLLSFSSAYYYGICLPFHLLREYFLSVAEAIHINMFMIHSEGITML